MIKLQRMAEFFDTRVNGYEEHQLTCIESAQEFYPYTASLLPMVQNVKVLDLGCGTGLELKEYLKLNPSAQITGIDLAPAMLAALKEKLADFEITLINGSYFEVPLGMGEFDAAVSVESLHHFTMEQKIGLYQKLHRALKNNGYFILTDYMAADEKQETENFTELARLKAEQGIPDSEFYHYDTPLTWEHEKEALMAGGFTCVKVLKQWENTVTMKAYR